jgi:cellulose synthase (UDP-forming)
MGKKGYAIAAWTVSSLLFLTLLALPVSVEAQTAIGASLIAVMMVIRFFDLKGTWRTVFFALGSAIIGRYIYWRLSSTIPPVDDVMNFIPAVILMAAELYCVAMLALSLFVVLDPLDREDAPRVEGDDAPTVDVFVPTYNEDADLLGVTLSAALQMDYPASRFRVYLLDDGGTDEKCEQQDAAKAQAARRRRAELQALCSELGATYLTRARNGHAKAGNLNAALARTDGDLVVVFDADHAPAREFLQQTVGHFLKNKRLFLVQTPHFFLNPDPIERNLGTFESMPSENEMFYGTIQRGLDKWNSAFFCGSAAVLRRAALAEVGGFSGESITEDAETALELHARGWHSLYVDRPMIAGLQPETLESFIGQRSRWCTGMMQILLLKTPLIKPGLSFAQRLCYGSSTLFWLFPVNRLIFLFAPLLYIFFDMRIFIADQQEFIAFTMIYMLSAILTQSYLYNRVRWPWISELYEYIQSIYLIRSIVGVIVNPRAPQFNVTKKGVTLLEDHLSPLAWPYVAVFTVLAAAMAVIVQRYLNEPASRDLLLVIAIWNGFNLVLAGAGLGVVSEKRERRGNQRVPAHREGWLYIDEGHVPVMIDDVSFSGVGLRSIPGEASIPDVRQAALLRLPRHGDGALIDVPIQLTGSRQDAQGTLYGTAFRDHSAERYRLVADLMFFDMSGLREVRLKRRERPQGVLQASLRFLAWGASHALRGAQFALFRRVRERKPAPASLARPVPSSD